jgi:antagonist of KipI
MSFPTFKVLKPGFLTTVQDRGRVYHQSEGASISGALDSFSFRIGNLLVGNSEGEAALEMTVSGPSLRSLLDTLIAITGANMTPTKNDLLIPMWKCIRVKKEDIISFGQLKEGCRGYLSVRNGISVPFFMGSRSTDLRAKVGGKEGRPLRAGDILESEPLKSGVEFEGRSLPQKLIPCYEKSVTLRVIMGPQANYFERDIGVKVFLQSEYIVRSEANRLGYRLDGSPILRKAGAPASIPTEGSCPGGIQVPEDGKPIILLNDQSGGGYTKIATIVSSDLSSLAQLKPGDMIRFKKVSVTEAHQILRKREKEIQKFKEGL